ncbi:hypothetical protein E3N88_43369 [Mikania micrantha]|uniref:Uncharacterized protein n=1 Tax=Mikania micrantha TaxID=192012 RepID=A0A5N6LF63_9ASTR|nr:hypothetical protein E3N88_43369 [Mikania micrantha]
MVAAHLAGLDVLQIIDEPVAAAIAYGIHMKKTDTNVLIFDLDDVTFDVSIVTIDEKGMLEVTTTCSDTHFGGLDMVDLMVDHFVKEFNRRHKLEMDITKNLRALYRLKHRILTAIQDLFSNTETTIRIDSLYNSINFSTIVNWDKLEYITSIHAANLIREKGEKVKALPTIPLLNIVPLSLGVDAHDGVKELTTIIKKKFIINHNKEKLLDEDIKKMVKNAERAVDEGDKSEIDSLQEASKNTPIPAEKEQIYFTTVDYQTSNPFNVYQGERSRAKDNKWLGEFEVAVSPAPKGKSKVKVVFNVDAEGTLNCWVKEFTTGLKRKIIIDNDKEKLSEEEIKKILKDAEKKMKTIGITDKTRLHAEEIKKMETGIEAANEYIDGNQELADVDEYKKVQNQLEKLCVGVIAQLV